MNQSLAKCQSPQGIKYMEPNYSKYSTPELEQTLQSIDQSAFPERTAEIKQELSSRQTEVKSDSAAKNEAFEANEQFYRCPNCELAYFLKRPINGARSKIAPIVANLSLQP